MHALIDTGPFQPCPAPFNLAAYVLAAGQATPDKIALQIVGLTAADDVLYLADPHARSLFRVDQAGKVTLIDGPPAAGVDSSTGDAAQ